MTIAGLDLDQEFVWQTNDRLARFMNPSPAHTNLIRTVGLRDGDPLGGKSDGVVMTMTVTIREGRRPFQLRNIDALEDRTIV